MPYMKLNVTRKLTYEQKKELADGLGEAIALIPEKNAKGLLLYIEDAVTMFNGGEEQDDYVFINTDICGDYKYEVKYKFTMGVYDAVQRILGTPNNRIAMKIAQYDGWANFGNYAMTDAVGVPMSYEEAVKRGL